jgi:hypothetical protein
MRGRSRTAASRAATRPRVPASALAAAALLPLVLLVACDTGRGNPLASFDARCAELPASRFEVYAVPVTYVEDGSQSIDELTVRGGNTPATHATFGLTTVRFGHRTDIALDVVEDAANRRACGTATVRVELSMQPVTVYVARELARTPCAHDATHAHELKHVAVFRDVLNDAARDLDADLAAAMGTGQRRAANRQELERTFNAQLQAYLSVFLAQWREQMNARQDAVDSPEEHERTATACRP